MRQGTRSTSIFHRGHASRFMRGGVSRWFKDGEGGDDGGGGGDLGWRAALPEQYRSDPALKDFKDLGSVVKSYIETKALVGGSLRPPGPEASLEQKLEFAQKLREKVPNLVVVPEDEKELEAFEGTLRAKLGKPKDAKEYSLDGLDIEGKEQLNIEELRETAAALQLDKKQFAAYAKGLAATRAAQAGVIKANQTALKAEWGKAYDERIESILSAAVKLDVDADTLKAVKSGLLTPAQMKVWWNIASALGSEPGEARKQGDGGSKTLTPSEAAQRAADIRARPEYWDSSKDPATHRMLVQKHAEYMEIAHA